MTSIAGFSRVCFQNCIIKDHLSSQGTAEFRGKTKFKGPLELCNDLTTNSNVKIEGDLCVQGKIISQNCACETDESASLCPLLPQPPLSTVLGTELLGMNCITCKEEEPKNVICTDLNKHKYMKNYEKVCETLSASLASYPPIVNPGKLVLTPNPALTIPVGQQAIYPPVPPMPLSLVGKNVLVVGASKGIGKDVAAKFVTEGANVVGTSRHPDCYPGPFSYPLQKLDTRITKDVKRFFANLMANTFTNGKIDIMILNPGAHWSGELADSTGDDMRDSLDNNVCGYQRCVHYGLPHMRHSDDTRIVTMSSIAGLYEVGYLGAYCMAKRALLSWNVQHQMESMQRKAQGRVQYEPTFVLLAPDAILTSIGLYEKYVSETTDLNNVWFRGWENILAYVQNVGALPLSWTTDAVIRIVTAPQPGLLYIASDFASNPLYGGGTIGDVIQLRNTAPPHEYINQIGNPVITGVISQLPVIQAGVVGALCPP